jgi:hypothetical protein
MSEWTAERERRYQEVRDNSDVELTKLEFTSLGLHFGGVDVDRELWLAREERDRALAELQRRDSETEQQAKTIQRYQAFVARAKDCYEDLPRSLQRMLRSDAAPGGSGEQPIREEILADELDALRCLNCNHTESEHAHTYVSKSCKVKCCVCSQWQPNGSDECDECDGSGRYYIDGVAQECICVPTPASIPIANISTQTETLDDELDEVERLDAGTAAEPDLITWAEAARYVLEICDGRIRGEQSELIAQHLERRARRMVPKPVAEPMDLAAILEEMRQLGEEDRQRRERLGFPPAAEPTDTWPRQGSHVLANCIHAGLLDERSRPHYDALTIAEMIDAQIDAALRAQKQADTELIDFLQKTCSEVGCNFNSPDDWTCILRGPEGEELGVYHGGHLRYAVRAALAARAALNAQAKR